LSSVRDEYKDVLDAVQETCARQCQWRVGYPSWPGAALFIARMIELDQMRWTHQKLQKKHAIVGPWRGVAADNWWNHRAH
jgi:hypothetical protein